MGKFRVKVKLTGLEIEVEGDRENGPEIAQNVSRQLSQVMQPVGLVENTKTTPALIEGEIVGNANRGGSRRRRGGGQRQSTAASNPAPPSVSWNHDPQRWGTPKQSWKAHQKIGWLLYVIEKATGKAPELTTSEITLAFNDNFRSAGLIRTQNVARDLGRRADEFGEMQGRWFLKDSGRHAAEKLVAEATGQPSLTMP